MSAWGAAISTGYVEIEPIINTAGDKLYFTGDRPADRFKGNLLLSPLVTSAFTLINYLAITKFGISFFDGLGLSDVWVSYKINGVWSLGFFLSRVFSTSSRMELSSIAS